MQKHLVSGEILRAQQLTIEFFRRTMETLHCDMKTPKVTCMRTCTIRMDMDPSEYWRIYNAIVLKRCRVYISRVKTLFNSEHFERFLKK